MMDRRRRTPRLARLLGAIAIALAALLPQGAGAIDGFPLEPADTSSPEATLTSFIEAIEEAYTLGAGNDGPASEEALRRAVRTLDLSTFPPRFAESRGIESALMLKEVIDRLELPASEHIPGEPATEDTPLTATRLAEGVTRWRIPHTEIVIARVETGPRAGEYLFDHQTIARARDFYQRVRDLPYREGATPEIYEAYLTTPGPGLALGWSERLPDWAKIVIAEQTIWQWGATGLVLLLTGLVAAGLIVWARRVDARRSADSGRLAPYTIATLAVSVGLVFAAQAFIDLTINLTGTPLDIVTYLLDIVGYMMLAWLAILVIASVTELIIRVRGLSPNAATGRLVRLASTGVAAIVVVGIIVHASQTFGLPAYSIITGLGVGGIAIGFGAQALVRDIFSGIFFLVDDAFRPGEYIDTGSAKGFVEQVSIRSVQLRHHNGPLQTIPFGEIQYVNNFSRDWVVMKLTVRVPFGTDTERVRKLIKTLGQELLKDPEIGDKFIEPLKSQGVIDIDDFGMKMRVKFMTKPGEQFVLRRIVYLKIQELFRTMGIDFAGREVRVKVEEDGHEISAEHLAKASDLGDDEVRQRRA
ncbi:mechanosensitive ion channel family protein [Acuticoccus kandeliae]|uniref:mechanosensitive ion channel family protein n=1 Tax=Acuticoccus kandeliae TaxID=2073160 RepID=UPI000D3E4FF0|nr:mechanosensitive ion channel family protein [Acuticoccus kandeliae]